jgi:hypothetical protein
MGSHDVPASEGQGLKSAREGTVERRTEKPAARRVAGGQRGGAGSMRSGRHAYLIRIPRQADQERALVSFRGVREAVHSVEEDEFLVTAEHLEALRQAGVPFEDITEPPASHGKEEAG